MRKIKNNNNNRRYRGITTLGSSSVEVVRPVPQVVGMHLDCHSSAFYAFMPTTPPTPTVGSSVTSCKWSWGSGWLSCSLILWPQYDSTPVQVQFKIENTLEKDWWFGGVSGDLTLPLPKWTLIDPLWHAVIACEIPPSFSKSACCNSTDLHSLTRYDKSVWKLSCLYKAPSSNCSLSCYCGYLLLLFYQVFDMNLFASQSLTEAQGSHWCLQIPEGREQRRQSQSLFSGAQSQNKRPWAQTGTQEIPFNHPIAPQAIQVMERWHKLFREAVHSFASIGL